MKINKIPEEYFYNDLQKKLYKSASEDFDILSNSLLRVNYFACAMREIFQKSFYILAPDEEVLKCSWFEPMKQNKPKYIARNQKIYYVCFRGIPESVLETLDIDYQEDLEGIGSLYEKLSNYVHIKNFITDCDADFQITVINDIQNTYCQLMDLFKETCAKLEKVLEEAIREECTNEIMFGGEIPEIDIIAPKYYVDHTDINKVTVENINSKNIEVIAEGDVFVSLCYAEKSDDPCTREVNFLFRAKIEVNCCNLKDLKRVGRLIVDNSDWFGEE